MCFSSETIRHLFFRGYVTYSATVRKRRCVIALKNARNRILRLRVIFKIGKKKQAINLHSN
jgi:hypothetical protein